MFVCASVSARDCNVTNIYFVQHSVRYVYTDTYQNCTQHTRIAIAMEMAMAMAMAIAKELNDASDRKAEEE